MIEDLPMHVLDELCEGRHSPVLPVRVSDENGETAESRTRLAFYRMENGQVDVLFYPALKSSPLERYDQEQQKQLLAGKAILADALSEDGRKWREQSKREWDKYTFGVYGCWVMDDEGKLNYVPEEKYTEELWNEQKKSAERNRAAALHK